MIANASVSPVITDALLLRFARDDRAATTIEYSVLAAIAGLGLLAFADIAGRGAFTPALDVLGDALSRPPAGDGGHRVH